MRRSTFNVHHGDGRIESLDREALVLAIEQGAVARDARIAIAGAAPRPVVDHPAFGKHFAGRAAAPTPTPRVTPARDASARPAASTAPDATRPRAHTAPTPSSRATPESAARRNADAAGPSASVARRRARSAATSEVRRQPSSSASDRSTGPSVDGRRTPERDVRTSKQAGAPPPPVLEALDLPLEATPFEPHELDRSPQRLLEWLRSSPPELIVGCRVNAGRAAVLRSAGMRARQIAEKASATKSAPERMAYDEASRVIDRAVRIVSQPGEWRKYEGRCRTAGKYLSFDAFTTVGTRSKHDSGTSSRSNGRAKVIGPAPMSDSSEARRVSSTAPPKSERELVEKLPDGSLLEASGVADMLRHMSAGYRIHAAKDESLEGSLEKAKEFAEDVPQSPPFYLPPTLGGVEDARPNAGSLHWGVGDADMAVKTVAPVFGAGLVLGIALLASFPEARAELWSGRVPVMASVRALLLIACAALGVIVIRKEGLVRVVGQPDPLGTALSVGLGALMGAAAASLLPMPLGASPTLGGAIAVLMIRAIGEWAFFDAFVARTLLCELKSSVLAMASAALAFGVYLNTYAYQWEPATSSALTMPLYAACIGLPAAYAVFRTRSALPALAVRTVAYIVCAIIAVGAAPSA